jgi:hypothetical protein
LLICPVNPWQANPHPTSFEMPIYLRGTAPDMKWPEKENLW